jgi:hypothetical protein
MVQLPPFDPEELEEADSSAYTDEDEEEDDSDYDEEEEEEDDDDSDDADANSDDSESWQTDSSGTSTSSSSSSSDSSSDQEEPWEQGDMRGRSWADLPGPVWELISGMALEAYSYDDETDQDAFTSTLAVAAHDDELLLALFSDEGAPLDAADLEGAHCKVVRRGRVASRPVAQSPQHRALRSVCKALRATMDDRVAGLAVPSASGALGRHCPRPEMVPFAFSSFARLRRLDLLGLAGAAVPRGATSAEAAAAALLGGLTALASLRDLVVPGELFAGSSDHEEKEQGGHQGGAEDQEQEQQAGGSAAGGGGGGGPASVGLRNAAPGVAFGSRTCSLAHLPRLEYLTRLEVRCSGPYGHEPLWQEPRALLPRKFPRLQALALEAFPLPECDPSACGAAAQAEELRLPRGLRSLALGGTRWDGSRVFVGSGVFVVDAETEEEEEEGRGQEEEGDDQEMEDDEGAGAGPAGAAEAAAEALENLHVRPSSDGGGGGAKRGRGGRGGRGHSNNKKQSQPQQQEPQDDGSPVARRRRRRRQRASAAAAAASSSSSALRPKAVLPPMLESLSLGPCSCSPAALAAVSRLPRLKHLAVHDVWLQHAPWPASDGRRGGGGGGQQEPLQEDGGGDEEDEWADAWGGGGSGGGGRPRKDVAPAYQAFSLERREEEAAARLGASTARARMRGQAKRRQAKQRAAQLAAAAVAARRFPADAPAWPALETFDWEISHPGFDTLLLAPPGWGARRYGADSFQSGHGPPVGAVDLAAASKTLRGLRVSLSALSRPAEDGTYHPVHSPLQEQLAEALASTLEQGVSQLTALTRLELSLAGHHEAFPRALRSAGRLPDLEVLNISGNSFMLADLPTPGHSFAGFPKLRKLLCYNTELGPDEAVVLLERLCGEPGTGERLRAIDLNDTPHVALLPPLSDWCPRLGMLAASDCPMLQTLCPGTLEDDGTPVLDVSRSALPRRLRALFFRNNIVPRDPCHELREQGVQVIGGAGAVLGPRGPLEVGDADRWMSEDESGNEDDEEEDSDDSGGGGGDLGSDASLDWQADEMAARRAVACGLVAEAAAEGLGGGAGDEVGEDEEWWARPGNLAPGEQGKEDAGEGEEWGAGGGGGQGGSAEDGRLARRAPPRYVHECPDPDGVTLPTFGRRRKHRRRKTRGSGADSDENDEDEDDEHEDDDEDDDDEDDDGGDGGGPGSPLVFRDVRVGRWDPGRSHPGPIAGGYYRRVRPRPSLDADEAHGGDAGDVPWTSSQRRRFFRHPPLPEGLLYASLGDGTRLSRPMRTLSAWLGAGGPRHLRSLDLTSMGLSSLPSCLKRLAPTLRTLGLAQNDFDGELPEVVGSLWALRDLCVGDCPRLSDVSSAVAKLPYLTSLGAARLPELTSIPKLGRACPRLRVLDLSGSGTAGADDDEPGPDDDDENAQQQQQQQHGTMRGTGLLVGRSVGRLTDLRMLCLRGCRGLRLPKSLGGCVALEHLDVSDTQLTGTLSCAQLALPSLRFLSMDTDSAAGPPPLAAITKLTSLRRVHLRGWREGAAADEDYPARDGALRFASAGGGGGGGRGGGGGGGGARARNRAPSGAGEAQAQSDSLHLLDRSAQRARERAARWVPFVAALAGAAPPGATSGLAGGMLQPSFPPAGVAPELETIVAPLPVCRALRASGVAARAARRGVDVVMDAPEMDGDASGAFWRGDVDVGEEQ